MATETNFVNGEANQKKSTIMGTNDVYLAQDLFRKSTRASFPKKDRDGIGTGTTKTYFEEMEPQTPVEAMVFAQIFALHSHAMDLMDNAQKALSIDCKQQYLSLANRIVKTFNNSLEAFGKFKRQGVQVVRVETVNVNDGGQAIVGTIQKKKGRG